MPRASRRIPTRPVRVPRVRDMGGARRVPWRDWAEWDRVRSGLCGDDPSARDASIARVADWRRRGRVPHAVDCTASLLETRSLDAGVPGNVGNVGSGAPLSENMLRLAYAAALVRMVNGAVDPSQKGKYAAPVMTLAKRMGIPAVLVDVRMAASHQEMPALALLRHASERALQWLFERYWHAQANQLRELRRGAQRAAEDLVRAEAARRVKAERANAFRKAERGKGKAKTRARNGGVHVEDEDENEDDDDDSSGGEDDDTIRELQNDDVEGADSKSRNARRTATNRLFAAASREDTETCAEALISVALDVSRAPDGEPPGSSPTLEDWRAVASRLLKRWPTLDEAMLLKAADAALEPGSPSTSRAAATDLGDARARAATAAATLFAETSSSKTQKTQPPAKRKRASARDGFLTQKKSPDEEETEKQQSDEISARREKTHWYLTRRALAFANAAVMTDARRAFVETLVRTAPGAGRSFKAAAARLLSDGEVAGSDPAEDAEEKVLPPASSPNAETDRADDDAFLAAARRDAAKRRGATGSKTQEEERKEVSGVFAKVSDWTPCAVGDLPAHMKTRGDRFVGSKRVDARDALRLAAERADFLVTTSSLTTEPEPEKNNVTKADLLWARWPRFVGFGAETTREEKKEKEEPRTNYAVGAPFADETRRALAGPGPDSLYALDYVPDEAVAAAGEMASGRFLCGFATTDGDFLVRDEIDETPARVSMRAAASLVFVDPDDDSDTEPMEVGDEKGTGRALNDGEEKETTRDAFGKDDDDVWGYDDPEEDDDETKKLDEPLARRDAISSDEEKDEAESENDDGVAVRVGGVRVKLSKADRNAVAADVECLM